MVVYIFDRSFDGNLHRFGGNFTHGLPALTSGPPIGMPLVRTCACGSKGIGGRPYAGSAGGRWYGSCGARWYGEFG